MAATKFTTAKGLKVEMWETSFRVEGMAKTVYLGRPITQDMVELIVDQLYSTLYETAFNVGLEEANRRLKRRAVSLIENAVFNK